QRALALEPTSVGAVSNAASLLGNLSRMEAAISVGEWAVAQDPLNTVMRANMSNFYVFAGRYDDCIAASQAVLRQSPGYIAANANLAQCLLLKGDAPAARVQA